MLVCDEANMCEQGEDHPSLCTMNKPGFVKDKWGCRMGRHNRWRKCESEQEVCNASRIKCNSLKYVTIDDIVETFGEREPSTEQFKKKSKGIFISVQDEEIDENSPKSTETGMLE